MQRCIIAGLLLLLAATHRTSTYAGEPLLSTNDVAHIHRALDTLIMTEVDLGFDKDFGEHRFLLPDAMAVLDKPLLLPKVGDRLLEAARNNTLPHVAIEQFGTNRVDTASEVDPKERMRMLMKFWLGKLQFDRHPEEVEVIRTAMRKLPYADSDQLLDEILAEPDALDPEPAAQRALAVLEALRPRDPKPFLDQVAMLIQARPGMKIPNVTWGTMNDDVHTNSNTIIIDPGGNDTYTGGAGVAFDDNAIIIDLAGDDRYIGNGLFGPGTAIFGHTYIYDAVGNDTYRCSHAGIGAALGGFAWVEDVAGNDHYQAKVFAQGAADAGLAGLVDRAGDDTYQLGYLGQAYAGVLGQGYLVDHAGNDQYLAGGIYPDHGHHEDRFMSMAQGFTIGMRPWAAGGIAALIDLGGNDFYKADVWGQGVSYWYAIGMLIDAGDGNDTYSMYHYGQGSGIHLSSGLLADLGGNDFYTGYALAQGNAHDYAVGMLLDHAGHDHYTANHYSQGRGMTNGFGMLLDRAGNDGYFAVRCDRSQGIGSDGWAREYGSIALLLDLLGKDVYSCGGKDNFNLVRPDHGVVYDAE